MTNHQTAHRNVDAPLERALSYAFRLIEKMEQSAAPGQLILVPTVIVWAMDQLNPALLVSLRETDSFDDFFCCLELFGALRPEAEQRRFETYLDGCAEVGLAYPDDGWLTAEDMLDAVADSSRPVPSTPARAIFERVLRQVIQRRPQRTVSSNGVGDRLSAVVHSYRIESDLDDSLQPLEAKPFVSYLKTALQHARKELVACDDGTDREFWRARPIYAWLETGWRLTSRILQPRYRVPAQCPCT
ncbi:hypothetical protein QF001_001760 [Paraburkholderia youngii]|uniref:hypothetical protein n=1 Tax=Paraburkholderia youngii TaxID=2782701 RepID=UPI003D22D26E